MAQIIDIEERRRPRPPHSARNVAETASLAVDPMAYLEPVAQMWQSWLASWSTFWLAPWGLRVMPLQPPTEPAPKNGTGHRG